MMVWNATVYEIMKHANRVISVFCIDFFPFKMHETYLQRVCTYVVDSGAMNVQSFLVC